MRRQVVSTPPRSRRSVGPTRGIRRSAIVSAVAGALLLSACAADTDPDRSVTIEGADASLIRATVEESIAQTGAQAVIVRVMRGDEVLLTQAWGESMTGVPATVDMHFRNGAVAIPQVATVLLQLVDEGVVSLDDRLSTWLPDVPFADEVELGQLAQMTSGYADYLWSDEFRDGFFADPFRQWTPDELVAMATAQPHVYPPGTNWNYAHTNYVLLGLALEEIMGRPLDQLIQERILDPLGMTETADPGTPELLQPALHAYDSERRPALGIPDGVPFVEESTSWNPSWSLARGAIQNSDITDTATVIRAVGRGDLLSDESHALQIAPTLRGTTTAVDGCPSCLEQNEAYTYGYGIVLSGDWLIQNPLFHGYAGVAAYLPTEDLTIAVAATYGDESFDEDGQPRGNIAMTIFRDLAAVLAPEHPVPSRS
ncbi:serine hydrolase domain-containing protein [Microbacterium schleiferi]|uniref:serine hydrolase domain-containing protein n=1 Tax=Microbacterium schleiferi TaxID=69362 RepID=UPI00311F124A